MKSVGSTCRSRQDRDSAQQVLVLPHSLSISSQDTLVAHLIDCQPRHHLHPQLAELDLQ